MQSIEITFDNVTSRQLLIAGILDVPLFSLFVIVYCLIITIE